jgi:hypothetical protein
MCKDNNLEGYKIYKYHNCKVDPTTPKINDVVVGVIHASSIMKVAL